MAGMILYKYVYVNRCGFISIENCGFKYGEALFSPAEMMTIRTTFRL